MVIHILIFKYSLYYNIMIMFRANLELYVDNIWRYLYKDK